MTQDQPIQIPGALRPYVKQVWVMDTGDAEKTANPFSIFADGYPGVFFHQSEDELILSSNNKKLSTVFLYGQTVKPVTMHTNGRCKMIVCNFYPHVLKSLFRFSAKEVTDECLDLKLLPAVPRINLTEQLWNTTATEKQIDIIFQYLHGLVEKNKVETDKGLQFATSQIITLNGDVSLKKIQESLHLTERTFERKFEEHIGISPKLLSKIAQFQASLSQLKSRRFIKLSDIAYENGYADQSHFIRSFKKFTGLSPLEFQKQLPNWMADSVAY